MNIDNKSIRLDVISNLNFAVFKRHQIYFNSYIEYSLGNMLTSLPGSLRAHSFSILRRAIRKSNYEC